MTDEIERLRSHLAESQAREKELREALEANHESQENRAL